MIDIINAKKAFKEYLKAYDTEAGTIKLKLIHTYGVVDACEYLAKELNLNEKDKNLAMLIGLLHDIGRFEQYTVSKVPLDKADGNFFNHAEYGVKILFKDNFIRNFVEDNEYDNIIYQAILNHNKILLPEGLAGKELLHSQIIRDADKVDNFRVKNHETFEVLWGISDIDFIENEKITDKIYETFMSKRLINVNDTETCLDRWCMYLAFIFDMNFDASLKYLKEKDLVNKNFDRIKYKNSDTINKITNMKNLANEYINTRI